jgi:hypothetical protein
MGDLRHANERAEYPKCRGANGWKMWVKSGVFRAQMGRNGGENRGEIWDSGGDFAMIRDA